MMTTALSVLRTRLQNVIGDTEGSFSHLYTQVINDSARELYPSLHRVKRYRTIITGNVLPNSHFEDWALTTIPDLHTASTGGCAQETTTIRGPKGTSSCKVTASGDNDYMSLTSASWPFLLDLMGKSVTFKCWAYPETANDATITIYTIQADDTEQTLTSTISCPAGTWTLLTLSTTLNDDLVDVQFRYGVATDGQYVIFDNARCTGPNIKEYLLPSDLWPAGTEIDNVAIQSSSSQDDPCDDLGLYSNFRPLWDWEIISDGTYRFLTTPYQSSNRAIEIKAKIPLEDDLDADAETMSVDDPETNLLVTYAAYLLFERLGAEISTDATIDAVGQSAKFLSKYYRLRGKLSHRLGVERLRLPRP
jgi:hypothetical protein